MVTDSMDMNGDLVLSILDRDGVCNHRFVAGITVLDVLIANGVELPTHCGGAGACGGCKIHVLQSSCFPITQTERRHLSREELNDGIRLACQVRPMVNISIHLISNEQAKHLRVLTDQELLPVKSLPEEPTHNSGTVYGVAIDFGTTMVRLTLWDLGRGVRISGRSVSNPLSRFGSDVLARISAANSCDTMALEMAQLCAETVTDAILDFAEKESFAPAKLARVYVVANTAMLTLISGRNYELLLQPEFWMSEVDCQPHDIKQLKQILGLNKNAELNLIPPIAGFVGSDLLAAVLYTKMMDTPEVSLLIDFGTNSEIALWDGVKLVVTSAAGGPAFDGCGISCGMPAEPGAICRIEYMPNQSKFVYETLNDIEPMGICGSGLIDAIASILKLGYVRLNGRFSKDYNSQKVTLCESTPGVSITAGDIDVFQRAKAAIAAGIIDLLEDTCQELENIRHIYICGAFGQHLNIENAQVLGLLPHLPAERFEIFGNAALAGCEELLQSAELQSDIDLIKKKAKIINLAQSENFEYNFINNLYLTPISLT